MAKVIATSRGFYGSSIREEGEIFEAEGKASWFKPLEGSDDDHDEKPKRGRKAKADDVPEPVRVKNEVAEATGSVQPDWVQG